MIRKRAVIHGRVQGIGFRFTARSEAAGLGLVGYVRNRADGGVETEIQGDTASVMSMLDWLESGPPGAVVESVNVTDAEPVEETGFSIEH